PATNREEIRWPRDDFSAKPRKLRLSDKEMSDALSTFVLCRRSLVLPCPTRSQKVVPQTASLLRVVAVSGCLNYGLNRNSSASVDSCSAFAHFHSRTAFCAACASNGFP